MSEMQSKLKRAQIEHDHSMYFRRELSEMESRKEPNNDQKECRCRTWKVIARFERHFGINLFINETRHRELQLLELNAEVWHREDT